MSQTVWNFVLLLYFVIGQLFSKVCSMLAIAIGNYFQGLTVSCYFDV